MVLYVGETVLIKNAATFDGVVLTAADEQTVNITIYDSTGAVVEAETAMEWNATKVRWEYSWDTSPGGAPGGTALTPGTYRVRVYMLSIDGAENVEYSKIKLKVNPVPLPLN